MLDTAQELEDGLGRWIGKMKTRCGHLPSAARACPPAPPAPCDVDVDGSVQMADGWRSFCSGLVRCVRVLVLDGALDGSEAAMPTPCRFSQQGPLSPFVSRVRGLSYSGGVKCDSEYLLETFSPSVAALTPRRLDARKALALGYKTWRFPLSLLVFVP